VATNGGELKGPYFVKLLILILLSAIHTNDLLCRQFFKIKLNILTIVLALNFRYKIICVLHSCFAFISNIGLQFITKLVDNKTLSKCNSASGLWVL